MLDLWTGMQTSEFEDGWAAGRTRQGEDDERKENREGTTIRRGQWKVYIRKQKYQNKTKRIRGESERRETTDLKHGQTVSGESVD